MGVKWVLFVFNLMFWFSGLTYAQNVLTRFTTQGQNKQMLLSWTLATGRICNGIHILRSPNREGGYEQIGFIGGICGSFVDTVSYEFLDESPDLNQNMFYFLNLAELGYSDTIQAYLAYAAEKEVLLYWEPNENRYRVSFYSNFLPPILVKVLSMNGSLIQEQILESNPDWLDFSILPPGWYGLTFQDDRGEKLKSQLVRVYSSN